MSAPGKPLSSLNSPSCLPRAYGIFIISWWFLRTRSQAIARPCSPPEVAIKGSHLGLFWRRVFQRSHGCWQYLAIFWMSIRGPLCGQPQHGTFERGRVSKQKRHYFKILLIWQQVCAYADGQRERRRDSQADSMTNMDPNSGLSQSWDNDLSQNRARHLTDWATQVPCKRGIINHGGDMPSPNRILWVKSKA